MAFFRWFCVIIVLGRTIYFPVLCSKCSKNKKDCLFSSLPQNYHRDSMLINQAIISKDKKPNFQDCVEQCKQKPNSKACAHDPKSTMCFVFNKVFDDVGIALQLYYGWSHIRILDPSGVVSILFHGAILN